MRWLKFSASVFVILWAVAANFSDISLPDGTTLGDKIFGTRAEAPPMVGPIQPKYPSAKPRKPAQAAPTTI